MAATQPGKVALITGASSGIGAAIAVRLGQCGMRVALVGRREDRLAETAARVAAVGGEALVVVADLADEPAWAGVLERVRQRWGPVDVLVNNAGLGWYGYFADMSVAAAEELIAVNARAIVGLTGLVLGDMRARRSGAIVNIGSITSDFPSPGSAVYSATKAFVQSFSIALRRELRGSGVEVGVVLPGPVRTEFFETARRASGMRSPGEQFGVGADRVAETVCRMLRRPRRKAYVPSVLRLVAGVEGMFGGLLDRFGPVLLRRQAAAAAARRRHDSRDS